MAEDFAKKLEKTVNPREIITFLLSQGFGEDKTVEEVISSAGKKSEVCFQATKLQEIFGNRKTLKGILDSLLPKEEAAS